MDSLTGKNSGDNLGDETPVIHFEQWEQDEIEVKLILKGGGCENKNIQYSLPCELDHLGRADRNLEGVRKCILHAVWQAQGQGCAPGAVGVCIGSDRAHGYDAREEAVVSHAGRRESGAGAGASWKSEVMEEANRHRRRRDGLRRQGFADRMQDRGGQSLARELLRFGGLRLLGVPAAGRAAGCVERRDHALAVSRSGSRRSSGWRSAEGFPLTGREVVLTAPLTEDAVRALKVGDVVLITRRDVHRTRRGARASDEESAAGGSARSGPVSLRSGDAEARRRVDGEGRRAHHQQPRGAVSGRQSSRTTECAR